jgi:hypothetical protein
MLTPPETEFASDNKIGWAAILILAACHDALRRDTASDALRRGFGNAERLNLAPTQNIGARLVYQNENCCWLG